MQVQEYVPEIDETTGVATCWIGAEPGQVRYNETYNPCNRWKLSTVASVLLPCFLTLSIRSGRRRFSYPNYFQTFAIRWRESDLLDPAKRIYHRDISGFVTMDGYELGGRVLQARSHASAIFSRVATSPTSCLPLTFSSLPRSAGKLIFYPILKCDAQMDTSSGIGADWKTLGTISLDIHVVEVGEANRLHEGFSSYYRRDEGPPLSSATPFSSTEVSSIRKIATFIFKYRPLGMLPLFSQ